MVWGDACIAATLPDRQMECPVSVASRMRRLGTGELLRKHNSQAAFIDSLSLFWIYLALDASQEVFFLGCFFEKRPDLFRERLKREQLTDK
jgi:hypothetical protein